MRLHSISAVNHTPEIYKVYSETVEGLKERFQTGDLRSLRDQLFEDYSFSQGYGVEIHKGKIKEGVELNELEVSMICDGGYSHFGGSSIITSDRYFTVEIYID